jgi:multidrug efflux pump subunit AcrA (membrane-fusion protein)
MSVQLITPAMAMLSALKTGFQVKLNTKPVKFILMLLNIFFLLSCKEKATKIHPTVEDISESVYASGIVKSKNQYQVFSSVTGIVKEVFVVEGDSVKIGTPLMKIVNKTANLNTANAKLAADYANLASNKGKLEEAKMTIDLALIKLKNDSLLAVRQQNLMSQNIGTKVEWEQKELNYQNSITNYRSAKIRYSDLQRQLELNANQSLNNFKINANLADDFIIKSEVSGKVYSLLKVTGESVTIQNPVAIIGDDKNFLLELQVDEYDIIKIKLAQKVLISMDSYKGKTYEAVIKKINPILNERSKSFTIEAQFINRPTILYPFLTVEANIVIRTKPQALTIPRSYLVSDSMVLNENKKLVKVTIGLKDYQKAEILSGITKDDFILNPQN